MGTFRSVKSRCSRHWVAAIALAWSLGCATTEFDANPSRAVELPYIKNTANECYFLDEFMPTPDSLVRGRNGRLSLRYYAYSNANYKEWEKKRIILSFYSSDDRCWSLYEEYYLEDEGL